MLVNGVKDQFLKNFTRNWEEGDRAIILFHILAILLADGNYISSFLDLKENTLAHTRFKY